MRPLDTGLEKLTDLLVKMGEIAEEMVALSLDGFLSGTDVEARVHSGSQSLATMGWDIEDKAFELIARYQPVASDLRIINSYVKIAYDFERYGRYAWDICLAQKRLGGLSKQAHPWMSIRGMAEKVMEMVHTSVKALKEHNAEMAKTLAPIEKEVDDAYSKFMDSLIEKIPTLTKSAISDLLVARYLERIADHAAYIGESIVFIATGEKILLR
jgi:phosphate transport system protein